MRQGRGEKTEPKLPLPEELQGIQPREVSNKALLFERFLRWEIVDSKVKRNPREVKSLFDALCSTTGLKVVENFFRRWEAMLEAIRRQGFNVKKFEAHPQWRAIFGLGGASALEVGFTFHKPLGFPIIPGSGLKGAARAYAKLVAGASEKEIAEVFGPEPRAKEHAQGKVVFFDAIPVGLPKLEGDVMNPHYGPYYQNRGEKPPADYYNPVPVPFVAIGRNSRFLFALASKDEVALEKAERWLKGALRELGVGAKTSAGYGVFEIKG
ncbi:MAG TPA: type III-B CRISPR module RAMP protein Cmr6 [Armatimonadetes bacterium]|nr:type III-B CRISPR module RAMP protein Cmr6 [Armatimonadota bacterium]